MMSFLFRAWNCFRERTEIENCEREHPIHVWGDLIAKTDLHDIQKKAIRVRVLSVAKRLRDRLFRLSKEALENFHRAQGLPNQFPQIPLEE